MRWDIGLLATVDTISFQIFSVLGIVYGFMLIENTEVFLTTDQESTKETVHKEMAEEEQARSKDAINRLFM